MAANKQPKKEVTKSPSTAVATATPSQALVIVSDQVPEHLQAAMSANRGNENVNSDDLVIPRLEIVQDLSAALKQGDAGYITGAKVGNMINSVTRQIYPERVFVVPIHYSKQYLVWKDINKGGGFFGAFPDMAAAEVRAREEGWTGKENDKSGIEIIDTPVHLCLLVDGVTGKVEEIMVSMPRTKAKVSRQWNSMIRMAGGDRFTRVYGIGTSLETKGQQNYWNFTVSQVGFPSKLVFQKAEETFKSLGTKARVMDVNDFDKGGSAARDDGDM